MYHNALCNFSGCSEFQFFILTWTEEQQAFLNKYTFNNIKGSLHSVWDRANGCRVTLGKTWWRRKEKEKTRKSSCCSQASFCLSPQVDVQALVSPIYLQSPYLLLKGPLHLLLLSLASQKSCIKGHPFSKLVTFCITWYLIILLLRTV